MRRIYLPFARWPLQQHVLLALLLVMVAATAGWWAVRRAADLNVIALQSKHAATKTLVDLHAAPLPELRTSFISRLPQAALTDQMLRDLVTFGESNGVQINSFTPQSSLPNARELGRVQISVAALADYKSTKLWLAELLARYPSLAVQTLSLRTPQNESTKQDVALSLVFYFRD